MPEKELFPNPTVKQVIFQIRYPNLFYIESKIGEFQLEIIEKFPESAMAVRKSILIADVGNDAKIDEMYAKEGIEGARKIWKFSSPEKYEMGIQSDSLDISSQSHKTYDNEGSETRFRDIIKFVIEKFFLVMKIPIIARVGLRYIDECPLPVKDNKTYESFYNTAFNIKKFALEESSELLFQTVVKRDPFSLRYIETLKKNGDGYSVILDFDAFASITKPSDCMDVTDKLHEIIISEFYSTIKEPVKDFMRKK